MRLSIQIRDNLIISILNDPPTPDPNWVLVNSVIYHHQETAYTCGPSSSMEALSTFGVTGESESEISSPVRMAGVTAMSLSIAAAVSEA